MKLVKFQCTVAVCRARDKKADGGAEEVKSHTIWINPEAVQMVAPQDSRYLEEITIYFRGCEDSTGVEGTFAEVVEKLTTA